MVSMGFVLFLFILWWIGAANRQTKEFQELAATNQVKDFDDYVEKYVKKTKPVEKAKIEEEKKELITKFVQTIPAKKVEVKTWKCPCCGAPNKTATDEIIGKCEYCDSFVKISKKSIDNLPEVCYN
jgi:ferredoxin-thioredoxin reductase catalytic subunit